ncbi:MAG: bifunctional pyr operon transcriptional regulator/uracil phosphoribosyltransferase PyrR [Desulfobacterales bacterium]
METIMDRAAVDQALDRMSREIIAAHPETGRLMLIGIKTRGVFLARRLQARIRAHCGITLPAGSMDITLYRDDWTRMADHPIVEATNILFSVDGRDLILVDDVLYTGRTIRAAMDAIMDFGRPDRIELAVLLDRGHRELPIQPDIVGLVIDTLPEDQVNVRVVEVDGEDRVEMHRSLRPMEA